MLPIEDSVRRIKLLPNARQQNLTGGAIMAKNNRTQDYWDERNEGHVDTRERNFKCENPDKHLGCDLGIDVQG